MPALNSDAAKSFFQGLYDDQSVVAVPDQFENMVSKLKISSNTTTAAGPQALQALMFNYIISDPTRAGAGKDLSATLGAITRNSVGAFTNTFPTSNLTSLITTAKDAGYDVEVA